jgi:hypothetical protein
MMADMIPKVADVRARLEKARAEVRLLTRLLKIAEGYELAELATGEENKDED